MKKSLIAAVIPVLVLLLAVSCGTGNMVVDNSGNLITEEMKKQEQSSEKDLKDTNKDKGKQNAQERRITKKLNEIKNKKWKYPVSASYSPMYLGNTLYLKGYWKKEPEKVIRVKAVVSKIEQRDGTSYFYYEAPKVGIRYLLRRTDEGLQMRGIKYPFPLFGFLIDVDIQPEMNTLSFPLKPGKKWTEKAKASATVLFIPIVRDIQTDFTAVGKQKIKTAVGELETYHIEALVDQGGGEGPKLEKYWYAKRIGYARSDTTSHYVDLVGYRIFNEKKGEFDEVLPKDGAENYE